MAIIKILVSGILIWLVTEFGKKSGRIGGLILSLPMTSIIALCWLWIETNDPIKVASVSKETLIFIFPSFAFFVLLWFLLNRGTGFYVSMTISIVTTFIAYSVFYRIRAVG